jgi:ATP-dependent Na+ efflux pump
MIAPGIFLFVFYFITVFLSNRMLTSTTEEKENRVTEIILTSISARTLILGKIISIIVLGIVQILTLLLTGVVMLFLISNVGDLAKNINLPDLSTILPNIRWEFNTIAISAIILIAGFMMVTGFIVALGAMMPTAQEASNYFGMIIMTLMAPLFVLPSFFVSEPNEIVIFLSYFPLTSPISLLLRNMLGTLSFSEALVGILLLIIFAIVAIWLAVRIFRFGTIAYGSKINLKSIFSKKKIA